jgi:hypothetical protein
MLRMREARAEARRLLARLQRTDALTPTELASVAEAYSALMDEHPELRLEAPLPLEKLKASVKDFRHADATMQHVDEDVRDKTRKLKEAVRARDEARAKFDALLETPIIQALVRGELDLETGEIKPKP